MLCDQTVTARTSHLPGLRSMGSLGQKDALTEHGNSFSDQEVKELEWLTDQSYFDVNDK